MCVGVRESRGVWVVVREREWVWWVAERESEGVCVRE